MTRVSVVVPAYNEADAIGACLASLARQTLEHELVVVDDGSTDDTTAIAAAHGVRVIEQRHCGAAVSRNLGASETRGDILVFLDADMTFDPEFLERLVAPIVEGDAVGTFTRDEYVANLDRPWARFASIAAGGDALRRMPADHGPESEVFRAIRRDAFERVGGYDDVGAGEDTTIAAKLGLYATLAEGAVCWHRNPERPLEVFVSARWYGRSRVYPHPAREWLRLVPPANVIRAARTGVRQRSLSFALFQLTHDAGRLAGFIDRDLLRRHEAR
jgi:glycosyltransferase involved in cell wall biosynthesis